MKVKKEINIMENCDYEILCQACINTYNGKHGKIKNTLSDVVHIDTGRVQVNIGRYKGFIVVAFQGSHGILDWMDNFKFKKVNFYGAKVHEGFLKQTDAVFSSVIKILNKSTIDEIIFTGHSLGGALATLMSFKFSELGYFNVWGCVTFGSPRVGDKKFSKEFGETVENSVRFVNKNDIVCKVPTFWMKYKHVKGLKRIGVRTGWKDRIYGIFGNKDDHYPQRYLEGIIE